MVSTAFSIRRLLNRRETQVLLSRSAALLPAIALALLDDQGQSYVAIGDFEAQPEAPECVRPVHVGGEQVGSLAGRGPRAEEPSVAAVFEMLRDALEQILARALEGRSLAQETLGRYREINLLYNIGETISASLDPDAIPHLVLAEASRIIETDIGVVLLFDEEEVLSLRAGFGMMALQENLVTIAHKCFAAAVQDGQPRILSAEEITEESTAITYILCAPLKTRERVVGFVVLGHLAGRTVFTADDEKLVMALAGQAAIAVDNARLFADVKQQRDAIAAMKNYMDNIFASIASGVITTDVEDIVTILNRAAEDILGVYSDETMGQLYNSVLCELEPDLSPLVDRVKRENASVVGHEMRPILSRRGPVVLQLHVSPLKDNHANTTGVAIVLDDLTEQRQLEEQVRQVRGTFERYVSPQVVQQLLTDPASVQLGGLRREVTVLFADIRGFTAYSENLDPEKLVVVLNRHLNLAAEAVLNEQGTLDKFVGDATMAIFNAPLAQSDHTLRAVRAALVMRTTIQELHAQSLPHEQLNFGVGIVTGTAVVGNIGSTALQNYTAIGDSVNLASRLQQLAKPGQIFINALAYDRVCDAIVTNDLGLVQLKGHSEPDHIYEVLSLRA